MHRVYKELLPSLEPRMDHGDLSTITTYVIINIINIFVAIEVPVVNRNHPDPIK